MPKPLGLEHMRKTLMAVLCVLAILVGPRLAQAGEKIDLKILYAGKPGSGRERDFVEFLKEHFTAVTNTDMSKFTVAQAAGVDVVLLDWDGTSEEVFKAPRPKLGEGYSRATVTIGVPGAFICGQRGLKTGYT
jgi:hypothetical protein